MNTPARILIVDDDETVLQTFAKALSLEGYDVRTAASPLVGLQARAPWRRSAAPSRRRRRSGCGRVCSLAGSPSGDQEVFEL